MARNIFQQLYYKDLKKVYSSFTGIILDNVIGDLDDIQDYLTALRKNINLGTQILISYHNPNWEPVLKLASILGLRKKTTNQNWLDHEDLRNLLNLAGFEVIKFEKRFFTITNITVAKPVKTKLVNQPEYSVSIVIPARNEAGNIPKIIKSIPPFGKEQEIIFIEGHSLDKTWEIISKQKNKFPSKKIKSFKQPGKGKADATWMGLKKSKGDILMIYDADRTVPASALPKFYNALRFKYGEFANGNRLLYPMQNDAMQTLNKIGNQFFSILFTWILGQRFKDTLCGTKVFWKKDFKKFKRTKTDPFGDFDLIFGAIRNGLTVIDIPVRYQERVYGKTNINRFYHGILLFKMAFLGIIEFKLFPTRSIR